MEGKRLLEDLWAAITSIEMSEKYIRTGEDYDCAHKAERSAMERVQEIIPKDLFFEFERAMAAESVAVEAAAIRYGIPVGAALQSLATRL